MGVVDFFTWPFFKSVFILLVLGVVMKKFVIFDCGPFVVFFVLDLSSLFAIGVLIKLLTFMI